MPNDKPQWMSDHEADDTRRFNEINEKLDTVLEVLSAFKLGGRGVMWVFGFIIAIGTIILLVIKIFRLGS